MDPTETENAHQLLGAPSCVSGSVDLPQGSLWSFSVTAAGQFHSSSLHKNLEAIVSSALTSLIKTLGPWRAILLSTQYIPRMSIAVADFESRLERDRLDWMLRYKVFQGINQLFGHISGPICHLIDSPASTRVQLEARSSSRNGMHLSTELEQDKRL